MTYFMERAKENTEKTVWLQQHGTECMHTHKKKTKNKKPMVSSKCGKPQAIAAVGGLKYCKLTMIDHEYVYPTEDGNFLFGLIPSSAVPLCSLWLKGTL